MIEDELNENSNGSSSTTSSVFEATNKYIENNSELQKSNENKSTNRTKSRSVSNESVVISNQDENSNGFGSSSSSIPKLGLKLVLKRHSGDKYEVKSTNSNSSPLTASSSLLINTQNPELLITRRPKREAARKVKFTFSESEYDLDDIPIRKKSRASSQSFMQPLLQLPLPPPVNYILKPQNKKQNKSTNINKNINIIISESTNKTSNQPSPNLQVSPVQIKFERSDTVSCSIDEKISIMKEQPFILIKQSKPFPIALVEDKTNVVYTKALLFLHLFKSYSCQCIYCPWCKLFLSVSEFSKHLHLEDIDEDEDESDSSVSSSQLSSDTENDNFNQIKQRQLKKLNKLKQKSFKILPYCTNLQQDGDDKLSESDIKTWKTFGTRFAQFKQIRAEQQKKEKELALLIKSQNDGFKTGNNQNKLLSIQAQQISLLSRNNRICSSSSTNVSSPNPIVKNKTFDDWDHIDKDKKLYYLSRGKIDYEKVTYISTNGEKLSDSEDEDVDVEGEQPNQERNSLKSDSNKINATKQKTDFTLSESEDEDDKLDHALSEEEQEPERQERTTKETINKPSHNDFDINKEKAETILNDQSRDSSNNCNIRNNFALPTLAQRYYNLYDNQSKSILTYMSKNQYTILPISYVNYDIKKRQLFLNKLKLANTVDFKTFWLCLTLNLECKDYKFKI